MFIFALGGSWTLEEHLFLLEACMHVLTMEEACLVQYWRCECPEVATCSCLYLYSARTGWDCKAFNFNFLYKNAHSELLSHLMQFYWEFLIFLFGMVLFIKMSNLTPRRNLSFRSVSLKRSGRDGSSIRLVCFPRASLWRFFWTERGTQSRSRADWRD